MTLKKSDFIDDLLRWFNAYKNYISTINYSNRTIDTYKRVIDEFIEYSRAYQDEMSIKDINAMYIISFLTYVENKALKDNKNKLKDNSLSNSSKRLYIAILKSFFDFIANNNDEFYLFDRVFKNIKIKNTSNPKENVRYLSDDEVSRIIKVLDDNLRYSSKKMRYNRYRDSLLIKVMLFAGLRISEALQIKLNSFIEFNEKVYKISIVGKGGKKQFAYIAKDITEEELYYFKYIKNLNPEEFIMITNRGNLLKRENAFTIVQKIYKKASVFKKGLHILRHTFAMRLASKDVNPLIIQKALRHSNINSTMIYAKAEEGDVAKHISDSPSKEGS